MIGWLVLLQASLTIAVAGPATSPEYLPLHVAKAENLFVAQDLDVTLRSARSDAGAAEALGSGRAQLAATSLDSALRLGGADGVPPRLLWGLTAAPPVALLLNPARVDTIRSVADLAGQTVGLTAPGMPEDRALGLLLARARIPLHRLTVRSLGERGVARALEGGEVAAAVVAEPYATRLVESGKAVVLVDLRTARDAAAALGGPTVNAGLFAPAGHLPRAATLRALAAALGAALARVTSGDSAVLEASLPPAVIGSPADFAIRLRTARRLFLPGGHVSLEALEHSVELAQRRAPLPARVKLPSAEDLLLPTVEPEPR
jgi:NitT/TauT family transport system substrate-binding protein